MNAITGLFRKIAFNQNEDRSSAINTETAPTGSDTGIHKMPVDNDFDVDSSHHTYDTELQTYKETVYGTTCLIFCVHFLILF